MSQLIVKKHLTLVSKMSGDMAFYIEDNNLHIEQDGYRVWVHKDDLPLFMDALKRVKDDD